MGLHKFGFIVTGAGLDAARNRMVMSSAAFEMIAVGVSEAEQGIEVARQLVSEGVQLIELCGGFGPIWTGRIIEAVDGKVPVGSVGYGPESLDAMYALFKK
jgi:predicted polyphosphate/ATP-dependent NAD kinase